MHEDSQSLGDGARYWFPFPSGCCLPVHIEVHPGGYLGFPFSLWPYHPTVPSAFWTHLSQGPLSWVTYIQPEGAAADTVGSSQRNQIPPPPRSNHVYCANISFFAAQYPWVITWTEFHSLHLLTTDIFPAENGSGARGEWEGKKPHPVTLRAFQVIACPTLPNSFVQNMFLEDLPCGKNYDMGYTYLWATVLDLREFMV